MDKYFGTWVYDNGIDYFKITFSKKERVKCCRGKMFHDELVSDFVYKKNSIIVYNTKVDNDFISGSCVLSDNKIILRYDEPAKPNLVRYEEAMLTIEYISGKTPKIKWSRKKLNMCKGTGEKPDYDMSKFSIPQFMELIRQ